MRWGNCLSFAVPDFFKNGGALYIEFWKPWHLPHFSVERNGKVYDFSDGLSNPVWKEFWFKGRVREFSINRYSRYPCKRYCIARKEVKG